MCDDTICMLHVEDERKKERNFFIEKRSPPPSCLEKFLIAQASYSGKLYYSGKYFSSIQNHHSSTDKTSFFLLKKSSTTAACSCLIKNVDKKFPCNCFKHLATHINNLWKMVFHVFFYINIHIHPISDCEVLLCIA